MHIYLIRHNQSLQKALLLLNDWFGWPKITAITPTATIIRTPASFFVVVKLFKDFEVEEL